MAIKELVLSKGIEMVVVGPEDPLVNGVHDFFLNDAALKHIPVIGPQKLLRNSKAVRNSPRSSSIVIISPQRPINLLTARMSRKAMLFWKL